MPKGSAIKYSPEQLDFIKSNCSLGRKELTEIVNTNLMNNLVLIRSSHYALVINGILVEQVVFRKDLFHGILAPKGLLQRIRLASRKDVLHGMLNL
jgi:hypothetical protein